jgi:hypothetical protein
LESYVRDDVKYRQMSLTYNVSIKTVRKWMGETRFEKRYYDKMEPQEIILLIDTTYFWKKYGYMIFRAWFPKLNKWKNLLWYKVPYETNDKYKEWFWFLIQKRRKILGIVCDWRQWLLWWFLEIPTQMCVYHMKQIITRYLTKKPKLEQNKKLKTISDCIWEYPKEDIKLALDTRYIDYESWINEKNSSWNYKHERTRKAYNSIMNKLSYCYTFKHYPELWIPKTNNSLEWINSHLKTKSIIHRWLKEGNKDDFTRYYLYIS